MTFSQKCRLCVLLTACLLFPANRKSNGNNATTIAQVAESVDRSPLSIAVSPDKSICLTANHTSSSVSVVDWKSAIILSEHPIGKGPVDVIWANARTVLVSLLHDDTVAILEYSPKTKKLKSRRKIYVGDEPRAIAVHGNKAFVAVSGNDDVAVFDWKKGTILKRIPVGGIPRTLTLSPDGRWLVTCCSVPGDVWVHDASTYKLISHRQVFDEALNPGVPVITKDSAEVIFPHQVNRTFPFSLDNVEKGWAIDNRLTRLPLPSGKYWQQKQMGLDIRGDAAGDANAVALSPDEKWLVITCGGSHELLILDFQKSPWPLADPGDFVPYEVESREGLLRRVELGGRPVSVKFIDEKTAIVANYFSNALQVVDVAAGKKLRTISLGGPEKPNMARRGEMIFHDADRSFDSWFSCATCHVDGHTSGQTFDTLNDNNYDTYKLTPSLRGVTKTAPWTWHGWQTSLSSAMKKSMTGTLHSSQKVSDDDVKALLAYLETLEHPTSPHRIKGDQLTLSARRGKKLFEGKADCISCHAGKLFTTPQTYKVGLESNRYFYPEFNPPSLRGLYSRRRFLHDGRAKSLQEVLTRHHQPEKLTGEKLDEKEQSDLIEYLKSL